MMAMRRAAVLVVDASGRLAGIFTERDVLTRVVARGTRSGGHARGIGDDARSRCALDQ